MNGLYDILIYDDSHAATPLIKGIIYKYKCVAGPLFEGYLHFTYHCSRPSNKEYHL